MRNAYVEVFRSYFQRMRSTWSACVWIVTAIPLLLFSLVNPHGLYHGGFGYVLMFGVGAPTWLLWFHFRQQIVDVRRMTWPGYVRPHVIVFLALSLFFTVGYPAAMALLGRPFALGLITCDIVIFAFLGLMLLTGWHTFTVFYAIGCIWLSCEMVTSQPPSWIADQYASALTAVLAAATIVSTLVIIRMIHLTEDDVHFHRRTLDNFRIARPRMTGETHQPRQLAMSGLERSKGPHCPPVARNFWTRAYRWSRLAGMWPISTIPICALGFLLIGAAIRWTLARLSISINVSAIYYIPFLLICGPLLSVPTIWLSRWQFFEVDFLRPIARPAFFKELGAAFIIHFVFQWSIVAAVITGGFVAFMPAPLHIAMLGNLLAASLAFQCFTYGPAVWLLRYRSPHSFVLLFVPVVILASAGVPVVLLPRFAAYRADAPVAICFIAILGIWIARIAYRQWLVTELG